MRWTDGREQLVGVLDDGEAATIELGRCLLARGASLIWFGAAPDLLRAWGPVRAAPPEPGAWEEAEGAWGPLDAVVMDAERVPAWVPVVEAAFFRRRRGTLLVWSDAPLAAPWGSPPPPQVRLQAIPRDPSRRVQRALVTVWPRGWRDRLRRITLRS